MAHRHGRVTGRGPPGQAQLPQGLGLGSPQGGGGGGPSAFPDNFGN